MILSDNVQPVFEHLMPLSRRWWWWWGGGSLLHVSHIHVTEVAPPPGTSSLLFFAWLESFLCLESLHPVPRPLSSMFGLHS